MNNKLKDKNTAGINGQVERGVVWKKTERKYNCPNCGEEWNKFVSTLYYDGEYHDQEKAVCQNCGCLF